MRLFRILFSAFLIAATLTASAVPSLGAARVEKKLWTVVIDPGHGDHDPGCVASDGKTYEKDIALDVAKKLGEKIETIKDTKVVLTRSDDSFLALSKRSDVANSNNADLFISVHVNAQDKGTSATGFSIHCLGPSSRKGRDTFNENFNICKRENAVISLESDYKTSYQGFDPNDPASYMIFSLMQNSNLSLSLQFADDVDSAMRKYSSITTSRGISQDPFLVLVRASMPAVLFEMGFITNADDFAALTTEEGREKIAEGLFQAVRVYKARIDGEAIVEEKPAVTEPAKPVEPKAEPVAPAKEEPKQAEPKATEPVPAAEQPVPQAAVLYGTQIIATGKVIDPKDKFFHGYTPIDVPRGDLHRYIIGISEDVEKAKSENQKIKAFFPDSYMVRIEEGKTFLIK